MSQQELDRGDQEVFGVVNGHSHPDAAAAAQEIADAAWEPAQDSNDVTGTHDEELCAKAHLEVNRMHRKLKRMEAMRAVLSVVACVCIAAALVAAWYVPSLLIWVVNVGVLVCGIAAAVKIDKYIRWWQ